MTENHTTPPDLTIDEILTLMAQSSKAVDDSLRLLVPLDESTHPSILNMLAKSGTEIRFAVPAIDSTKRCSDKQKEEPAHIDVEEKEEEGDSHTGHTNYFWLLFENRAISYEEFFRTL
jgi:hypothetical protein